MEELEAKIKLEPYNITYWNQLISESHKANNREVVRNSYTKLLERFPTSVKHWIDYIDYELNDKQLPRAERLFGTCAISLWSLDISKKYLNYIKLRNCKENGVPKGDEERTTIIKAYEFVLQRLGYDREAGTIWLDFLKFLRSLEYHNSWEKQQADEKVRKVYHMAIANPTLALEQIWRDYEAFENLVKPAYAKKNISEKAPLFQKAKGILKQFLATTENVTMYLKTAAKPPTWNQRDIKMADSWRTYINFEKSNPLQLDNKDALNARIIFAYNQALIGMRHFPEIWVSFGAFYLRNSKKKEAEAIFTAGMKAIPTSFLLTCAYAEFQESQKRTAECYQVYDTNIQALTEELTATSDKYQKALDRIDSTTEESLEKLREGNKELDGELKEDIRRVEKLRDAQKAEVELAKETELNVVRGRLTLIWINYMKSARRCEGLVGVRKVFSNARKSENITYHIFVENAMIEYHASENNLVAEKVFKLGLQKYNTEPGYILEFVDFLIQTKDTTNARALFEQSFNTVPKQKHYILLERLATFESMFGDITGLDKATTRLLDAFPNVSVPHLIAERTRYLDLSAEAELGPCYGDAVAVGNRGFVNVEEFNDIGTNLTPNFFSPTTHTNPTSYASRGNGSLKVPGLNPHPQYVPQQPQVFLIPPNGIPDQVQFLLSQIPSAPTYDGPGTNLDQLLVMLHEANSNLPTPIRPNAQIRVQGSKEGTNELHRTDDFGGPAKRMKF